MHRHTILAAALFMAACGSHVPSDPSSTSPADAPSALVTVASSASGLDGSGAAKLDFARIRDLHVRLRVPAMSELATLRVTLRAPDGQAAWVDVAPFSTDVKTTSLEVPGMDHPITVQPARRAAEGFLLDRTIPVAGTTVERFAEPGEWTVEADLDGEVVARAPIQVALTR